MKSLDLNWKSADLNSTLEGHDLSLTEVIRLIRLKRTISMYVKRKPCSEDVQVFTGLAGAVHLLGVGTHADEDLPRHLQRGEGAAAGAATPGLGSQLLFASQWCS